MHTTGKKNHILVPIYTSIAILFSQYKILENIFQGNKQCPGIITFIYDSVKPFN